MFWVSYWFSNPDLPGIQSLVFAEQKQNPHMSAGFAFVGLLYFFPLRVAFFASNSFFASKRFGDL